MINTAMINTAMLNSEMLNSAMINTAMTDSTMINTKKVGFYFSKAIFGHTLIGWNWQERQITHWKPSSGMVKKMTWRKKFQNIMHIDQNIQPDIYGWIFYIYRLQTWKQLKEKSSIFIEIYFKKFFFLFSAKHWMWRSESHIICSSENGPISPKNKQINNNC